MPTQVPSIIFILTTGRGLGATYPMFTDVRTQPNVPDIDVVNV